MPTPGNARWQPQIAAQQSRGPIPLGAAAASDGATPNSAAAMSNGATPAVALPGGAAAGPSGGGADVDVLPGVPDGSAVSGQGVPAASGAAATTRGPAPDDPSGSDDEDAGRVNDQPDPNMDPHSLLRQDPGASAADLEGVLHGLEAKDRADVAEVPRGAMQNAPLHNFQKRSLGWMLQREQEGSASKVRGGILADEPGLGKTVQTLALIVTSPFPTEEDANDAARAAAREQNLMETHVLGQRARAERFAEMSTPVVPGQGRGGSATGSGAGPSAAGGDGAGPISGSGRSGSGGVKEEKKPRRQSAPKAPPVVARCSKGQRDQKCTCVICRKAVEQERKRLLSDMKTQAKVSSKKRKAEKAFADGTGSWETDVGPTPAPPSPTVRGPSGGIVKRTLVVVPTCVATQWVAEVRAKTPQLSVCLYHGGNRQRKFPPVILASYDIVITTFGMVNQEHNSSPIGPLFRVRWFRVVLDEAQGIRNHRSQTAKACCSLQAEARWCLSGTPIVNSATDAYSLFNFIRYRPFSDIHYFNEVVTRKVQKGRRQRWGPSEAIRREGYRQLQVAMSAVTMRRLKTTQFEGRPIIELPKREVNVVVAPFATQAEREWYEAIENQMQIQFNRYVRDGFEANYACILVLLTKLRLACIHPWLAQTKIDPATAAARARAAAAAAETAEEAAAAAAPANLTAAEKAQLLARWNADGGECCICMDAPGEEDAVLTRCGHGPMCRLCIEAHLQNQDNHAASGFCPLCRCELTPANLYTRAQLLPPGAKLERPATAAADAAIEAELQRFLKEAAGGDPEMPSSTKIDAVLSALDGIRSEDEAAAKGGERQTIKTVVFSYSTRALDILEPPLRMRGFPFVRIDGSMSLNKWADVVRQFHHDPEVRVLLCSTKAGGVGLNLTCASRVILIDVWWNMAPEDQAIDRCHRLGQTRDVIVTKLITAHHNPGEETVKQRMLTIQVCRHMPSCLLADWSCVDRLSSHIKVGF